MPTYSYYCEKCQSEFELFFNIKNYIENPPCCSCNSTKTQRAYIKDFATQNTTVKKSDSELKTIGDLARRNSDRFSEDHKTSLYQKHNSYKEEPSTKELPKGMSRIKKPPKTIWPK